MSATFWWLILFGLILWMTVKTARASGGLAILVFLFWPAALIAVIKHWGDPASDIRLPFVLAVIVGALAFHSGNQAVEQFILDQAPYMTEADIERIRRDNPEMADKIMAAREGQQYEDYDEEEYDDAGYDDSEGADPQVPVTPRVSTAPPARRAMPAPSAPGTSSREPERSVPVVEREPEAPSLDVVASRLSYRLGKIELGSGGATLALPGEFRFATKSSLLIVARLREVSLDDETLGWAVHRDVDLADPDAWFVEVRYRAAPALSLAPLAYAERVGVATYLMRAVGQAEGLAEDGLLAPAWDAQSEVATASVQATSAEAELLDAYAIRPLAQGALIFVMRGSDPSRHELGLRATRLLAARSGSTEKVDGSGSQQESSLPPSVLQWLAAKPAGT